MNNPFIYGRVVKSEEFIGRNRELRKVCGRINNAESTAIIGMPHIGKTSLLTYLLKTKCWQDQNDQQIESDFVRYLDVQTLGSVENQAQFWTLALTPLAKAFQNNDSKDFQEIAESYQIAQNNNFGTWVLEQLFKELENAGYRFILLLDEFDDFLQHPVLNSAEFYGGLRSLSSLCHSLIIVLAARKSISQLNQLTRQINPHSSPYFNTFTEIDLGAWSENDVNQLFEKAGDRFNNQDYNYIHLVSGLHPYLAQMAASVLWDVEEQGYKRYQIAGDRLDRQSKAHFEDCWRSWTNEIKKAITMVALNQIPDLIDHEFSLSGLTGDLNDFSSELRELKQIGLLEEDNGIWKIRQTAFIWWLADELKGNVREEEDFQTWLRHQEIDGGLTKLQQEEMGNIAHKILSVLGKGATTLIEALARSIGSGLV